ncbi:MAG: hypothetical protein KY464_13350 [Gemmatimonadetes bacterium]|nr:hypothetical protein [Gemmatimonadota bacterium]
MSILLGIDGGGTHTTLALADSKGKELARRTGPAGIVDPRDPEAAAAMLARLARETMTDAGLQGPASVLCAGLAGVGSIEERSTVQEALLRAGIAERVLVRPDGETALVGAVGGGPGILLIGGTGSVGWGRGDDGRVEHCGGWGMMVGDEGSGFGLGRAALAAALRGHDGRGPATALLDTFLRELDLASANDVPPWVGRAAKSEIAALAVYVVRAAVAGDEVAERLVQEGAQALAEHAAALVERLAPWVAPPPVVLHGGLARNATFGEAVRRALAALPMPLQAREPVGDAVSGAVRLAWMAADQQRCR